MIHSHTIMLTFAIILSFIFIFINKNNLKFVETASGAKYFVQSGKYKKESAELLEKMIHNMYALKKYLVSNIKKFPKMEKYIKQLSEKLTEERTIIKENTKDSDLTSYSVNKGEELVFCLKSKKSNKNHDINLLMYVTIHELAHLGCPEIGHTALFNKIFNFFLQQATQMSPPLYKYEDYTRNPTEYCGMVLTTNILN
jgi:predicted metal-dependent hydrolase